MTTIIGILAAIAIPKFADLVRKSKEGATKGNLGALRAALAIYYGDMEGQTPGVQVYSGSNLSVLTVNGKYLAVVPVVKTPDYHPESSVETDFDTWGPGVPHNGGWLYFVDGAHPETVGQVYVDCLHTDTKGTVWTVY